MVFSKKNYSKVIKYEQEVSRFDLSMITTKIWIKICMTEHLIHDCSCLIPVPVSFNQDICAGGNCESRKQLKCVSFQVQSLLLDKCSEDN